MSESESSGLSWSNWAGSVRCTPRELARPATEEALVSLVRAADIQSCHVRVAGSGHSFTPLVETDGILVSLDDYAGIESHDRDALQATVRAGTKLHDLGEPLLALGMAMENLGDIDVQALGGALGTGTHGTGRSLCNLSSQARVLRLVTAVGEKVES